MIERIKKFLNPGDPLSDESIEARLRADAAQLRKLGQERPLSPRIELLIKAGVAQEMQRIEDEIEPSGDQNTTNDSGQL